MICLINLEGRVALILFKIKDTIMKTPLIPRLTSEFEKDLYMYIPLTIILQSCLGSIAAMLILMQGTTLSSGIQLTICVVTCMVYNAALLAQLKASISFWLLIISLVVNSLLVIVNLL